MRAEFVEQQRLLGVEVVFSADDTVSKIPLRQAGPQEIDDEAVDLGEDSTLVRRSDWW